ncbi:amidase [Lampropedia aestuarii]|uniref:amidase n=1 Tax=Lampropedia aestuarii TaxID=2562762 RepID=UPI002469390D|nr:amidase [Lampropedia aestuarii]MDH5856593.1 amidase [Lampropedia aestuarii]
MSSITELQVRYHSGSTTPALELERQLQCIANSQTNAFITVAADAARQQSRAATQALTANVAPGLLHGMTVAVKDLIDVQGLPTTCGSAQGVGAPPAAADAPIVARLRAAGAVVIGKANTHEFAYGATGDRSHFGPVANPHNLQHMTGGSSSGSAAAVSEGLAHMALGTDTSGSIRIPAAMCGVVGLKPTFGLLPVDGVRALSPSLDHVGPITATVQDCALVLAVLTESPSTRYWPSDAKDMTQLRIGIPSNYFNEPLSATVAQALKRAAAALEQAGAAVVPICIAGVNEAHAAQQRILQVEALDQHAPALQSGAPFGAEVHERLQAAHGITAADYLHALRYQQQFRANMDAAFQEVDVVLTPTCPMTAPLLQERDTPIGADMFSTRWLITRCTVPASLSGHPALSIPFGYDDAKLPIGLQLIGPLHGECTLFDVGAYLERANKHA